MQQVPQHRFPLRAAGIDVGSNAMRLLVVEFGSPRVWTTLAQDRLPVRLGASVFGTGDCALGRDAMERGLDALRSFRHRMDELGVVVHRAVATSAVREASDGAEFLERARAESGIALEAITPDEEIRLVWLAVSSRMHVPGSYWMLIDVGGGSVEVARADGDVIVAAESYALGAVRLLQSFGGVSAPQFRRLVAEAIDAAVARLVDVMHVAGVVATGGNIEELARVMAAPEDASGTARVPLAGLQRISDRMEGMSPEERIDQLGVRPDRADVVWPAALVYERIARAVGADHLIVPHVGVREGLIIDAVDVALHGMTRDE